MHSDSNLRVFRCSRFWDFNVHGALVAGVGGGFLMFVMFGIAFWGTESSKDRALWAGLALVVVITLLCIFFGKLSAGAPLAVGIEAGKKLHIYGAWTTLYVPIEEVRAVRSSFLNAGIIVHLNRRHGLIKKICISWQFGSQAQPLVLAILEEIQRYEQTHLGG